MCNIFNLIYSLPSSLIVLPDEKVLSNLIDRAPSLHGLCEIVLMLLTHFLHSRYKNIKWIPAEAFPSGYTMGSVNYILQGRQRTSLNGTFGIHGQRYR